MNKFFIKRLKIIWWFSLVGINMHAKHLAVGYKLGLYGFMSQDVPIFPNTAKVLQNLLLWKNFGGTNTPPPPPPRSLSHMPMDHTSLLWQKEASDKSDISCKRAKCVWHFHWRQWNIMMSYLTYLLAGWVFMDKMWCWRRAHWVKYKNINNSDFDGMPLVSFCQSATPDDLTECFVLSRGTLRQQVSAPWSSEVRMLLDGEFTKPRKGSDAGDHPPITPMRGASESDLGGEAWRVYEYIARHFIATVGGLWFN